MIDREELERLHEAATNGPWEVDAQASEGEYGSGPNTHSGYRVSVMFNSSGKAIFDAHNSDVIEVHEEFDDEGFCYAWDDTSSRDFALIAYLRNAVPDILKLMDDLAEQRRTDAITMAGFRAACEQRDTLAAENAALTAKVERLEGALKIADDAISEMFRYYDGGEMRGSYDGKPERNQLRKAGYVTRAALKGDEQ